MNLILLSPSKEMNDQQGTLSVNWSTNSYQVATALQSLSLDDIQKQFHLSDKLALQTFHHHQHLFDKQALPAYLAYQGLAFRQIDWSNIQLDYAQKHLAILSALYGLVRPLDPINSYRLDLKIPLKIQRTSLKSYWQKRISQALEEQRIYNLASKEFFDLVNLPPQQIVQVNFYQDASLTKKAPSATCKKLRGALANHLLQTQSFSWDTFACFTFDQYQLNTTKSQKNHLIYHR